MIGWIKLYRDVLEHWIYKDDCFDRFHAWCDLLMLANYEAKKVQHRGAIVVCERGTVNVSMLELSKRWGWSRGKVSRFLDVLESDGMVTTERTRNRTTITIVNYGKFQDVGTTDGTTDGTSDGQRTDITKNNKNIKNIKNYKSHQNSMMESPTYKGKTESELEALINGF